MNKRITLLLFVLLALGRFSASAQAPFLSATPSTLNFRATGDSSFFVLTCSDSIWTISTASLPQGFAVFPLTGRRGTTTVYVLAPNYTGTFARTVPLNISSNNTPNVTHSASVLLIQAAANIAPTACSDSTEPNNTLAEAFDLGSISGTRQITPLCLTNADNDYFKFMLNGTRYYARVRGFSSNTMGNYGLEIIVVGNIVTVRTTAVNGSNADTYLYLLNANGESLAENDDYASSFLSQVTYNFVTPESLSVSRSTMAFSAAGGSDTFAVVSANLRWNITGAPTWLTVNPLTDSINGRRTVTVTATANTLNFARTAYLTVASGSRSFRIYVTQAANVPVQTPCLDANEPNNTASTATNVVLTNNTFTDSTACLSPAGDEDFYRFTLNGLTYYAKVRGFSPTTVGKYGLRITTQGAGVTLTTFSISGSNTDTYLYLIDANGAILASNDDYAGTLFSNIVFNTALRVSPTALSFASGGGTQTVSIYSSSAWTLSGLPQWLTASAVSGVSGSSFVTLTAIANADTLARNAVLGVSNSTAQQAVTVTQATAPRVANCNDPYEPNNTVAAATNIGTIAIGATWQNANLCLTTGDADYLRFVFNGTTYYAFVRGFTANNIGLYGLRIVTDSNSLTLSTYSVDGRSTDTYLFLLNAAGVTLAQNDDSNGNLFSFLRYQIGGNTGGGGIVSNDEPCGAINLTASATPNCVTGDNTLATITSNPSPTVTVLNASGYTATRDVWYRCLIPASGVVTIRTTVGSMTDAIMAIYQANDCDSISPVALAAEDDNYTSSGAFMPVLTVRGAAGAQLFIRIWGFGGGVGTFNICALNFDTANIVGGGGTGQSSIVRKNTTFAAQSLRAFPNPANDQLNVIAQMNVAQKDAIIELFDVLGRKVLSQNAAIEIGENQYNLNVANLTNGIYLLRIGEQQLKVQIMH